MLYNLLKMIRNCIFYYKHLRLVKKTNITKIFIYETTKKHGLFKNYLCYFNNKSIKLNFSKMFNLFSITKFLNLIYII